MPSIAASYLALEGILAALYVREVTGRGQWVETSLYQGVLAFTTQLWQDVEHRVEPWFEIGFEPRPSIYECADGLWVHSMHFAGGRGKDRSVVWEILGVDPPDLEWSPTGAQAFDDVVRDAIGRMKRQDLLDRFWANEIAIAPVRHAHEALEDEQVINNGMSVVVDDPRLGPVRQAGISFRVHGGADARGAGSAARDRAAHRRGARRTGARTAHAHAPRDPRSDRSRTRSRASRSSTSATSSPGPSARCCSATSERPSTSWSRPQGDQMRPVTQPFNGCQRGKLDVVVDLKQPEGLEIAHRLIREVDVVHHNMRPGVAERLGVDYETAKRLNPTVIYCHTTMWGNDGPRATWPGFDQLAQSSCGLEQELGGEGNGPNWYRFGMCDQACAVQSALAVLMALYWRERTGEGQLVDTSIVNGGVHLNTDAWIGPDGSWSERPRTDSRQTGLGPLYRLYPTSDGWLAVACLGQTHWAALAKAVPDLDDPRFGDPAGARPTPTRSARCWAGSSRRAPPTTPSTCSTGPGCRSRSRRRTPGARGSTNRTSSPPGSSPTTSTRPTGASASSATSCSSRRRPAPSVGRHRCSASTRGRCSSASATRPRRSTSCASVGVTVWPD